MHIDYKILKKNIILIFFLSLSLRLLNLFFFEGYDGEFIEDSASYFQIAIYAEENGFKNWISHSRPPLISLIIIPIIKVFNPSLSIILIKIFMVLISVFTCILIYLLTFEISKSNKISFVTSIIYSLYPFSIFISGKLLTENLASLLVCLIILFFLKFVKKISFKFLIISSIFMGLLSLTRSSYYYLPFILSFLILFLKISNFKKLFSFFLIYSIFFLTLSPWIIKNYVQLNEIVPTTTRLGYGLWLSNNDFKSKKIRFGGYEKTPKFKNELKFSEKFNNPIKASDYLKDKAFQEIKNNKIDFLKACIFRFLNFFNPKPNPYSKFNSKDIVMILFFSPILIIFLLSLLKPTKNLEKITILIIIFYALSSHLPFYGFPRFRLPVDSLIILYSTIYFYENIKSDTFKKFFSMLKNFRE